MAFAVSAFGRKHIKLERNELMDRSIGYRLCASLDDASLFINALDLISEMSVVIVNVATGEVVYTETYIDFEQILIDVSMLDAGKYKLQLALDTTTYLGNFSIE